MKAKHIMPTTALLIAGFFTQNTRGSVASVSPAVIKDTVAIKDVYNDQYGAGFAFTTNKGDTLRVTNQYAKNFAVAKVTVEKTGNGVSAACDIFVDAGNTVYVARGQRGAAGLMIKTRSEKGPDNYLGKATAADLKNKLGQ